MAEIFKNKKNGIVCLQVGTIFMPDSETFGGVVFKLKRQTF